MDKPILGQTTPDGKGGFSSETGNGADPAPELDWKLPSPDLYVKLRLLGQPDQGVFFIFIEEALKANADPDDIIKACLETQSPYRAGSIHRLVMQCGGEE